MKWTRGALAGLLAWTLLVVPVAAQEKAKPPQPEGALATAQEPVPPAPVEYPDTWYAQALAHSEVGLNVTHFWSKGPLLRAETVVVGRRVVTIVNGGTYYAYDGLGRSGVAVGRDPSAIEQDAERKRPFGNELAALLEQGAESVGFENLGGREVEVFRVTDDRGRRQVWVTAGEERLPLRVEVFRRQTGQTLSTDFLNWMSGISISDDFFEPESGIDFVHLSFDEYLARQADGKPLGPVPVFYTDLLHAR
jgi:outer membrane lipoprotein-sorting protein